MKQFDFKKAAPALIGISCGILNGLFGAGGGIAAVPLIKCADVPLKKAHATSLAVILPVSLVSAVIYLMNGSVHISDAFPYLPGGLIGAMIGAFAMSKISGTLLRKAFGIFMIYAAIRLFLK